MDCVLVGKILVLCFVGGMESMGVIRENWEEKGTECRCRGGVRGWVPVLEIKEE